MSIVITGANGQLGRLVIADLLARGVPAEEITAVVRSAEKGADLGVRLHVADYDQPETFKGAFAAGDRVLLISGSEPGRRVPQHRAVIDAAAAAGVAQLAYTGVFGGPDAWFALAADHRGTEELIRASGLPHTFLRNNWYSEMYTGDVAGAIARGAVANAVDPDSRIATAPRRDFAAAAAAVLTGEGHLNRAYELSGDTAWTFGEFAAEVSRQSGKPVAHATVTPAELTAILLGVGLPEGFVDILVEVDDAINKGALAGTPGDLATLIGRPTTPIAETIAEDLAKLN
ncbi:NAD(P)-dependent oxidoreductase [Asanoa ishikariensis]|uniref:NAD(P)H dehydrogenase (Quinone) n=1 Tax=Asanoa ishikariensis TaxID=137265 RepID=A0A1H3T8T8_9ACTN|nr:NAD(P)H-binding protein [Asanoa ishikariensis]GIF62845.1 NAD(P)-dependent oxidoreductase [Asanoa ishikariensis]SDZ46682.1 NAD(P)H dehydrogenase (quinone) [Asanoa ishikariensis]